MRIRPKITLFTSAFLVLVVIVLTYLSVRTIRTQGDEQLRNYKADALQTVNEHLKDLVDIAYETIDKNYKNLNDRAYLERFYATRLTDIMNTGEAIVERYKKRVANRQMSLNAAKAQAIAEIRELRFDGGTGYIWINDTSRPYPKMVMNPFLPQLEGKVLDDARYNTAFGAERKNLFLASLDVTEDGGDGYIDFLWPKPNKDDLTEEEHKLSYVRRYDDWGWVMGTGIYIDDARNEIENRIKETIKSMRYANGVGYFWINDTTRPFPRMVMHSTTPELEGKILDSSKFNNAEGISKNVFVAINDVVRDNGGQGYVDHLWTKPVEGGLSEEREKISYVRLFEPFGWIIGTGVYVDTIDEAVEVKRQEILDQIFNLIKNSLIASVLFVVLACIVSSFFAKTIATPIEQLAAVADDISRGKNLSKPILAATRNDEIGELAQAVERLKSSVKIMLSRMTKK